MENNNTRRPARVGRTILIAVLAVVILVLLFEQLVRRTAERIRRRASVRRGR